MKTQRIDNTNRFIPTQRVAIDGKSWWVVYDLKQSRYSTYTCFGKYKTKRECQSDIDYCVKNFSTL